MKPEVGMIVVHQNKYAWEIVGVHDSRKLDIRCAFSPDVDLVEHWTFVPDLDKLYPDLLTVQTVARLTGVKLL